MYGKKGFAKGLIKMKEENKKYTAAEIARYHVGKMSAQEMHAIEKAALQDPFLSDALEGYEHAPHFEEDLEDIRSRLAEKRKKKKVFSFFSLGDNGWWRVAALFIVIAGAGYFFYRSNEIKKQDSLTQNLQSTPLRKTDTVNRNKDSATTNSIAFENNKTAVEQNEKASTNSSIKKELSIDKRKALKPLTGKLIKSDSTVWGTLNNSNTSQGASGYVLAGKLTDQQGKALPFATITDMKSKTATITDTAGIFFIRSHDSAATAIASAAGYVPQNILLKSDVQPTIEMKKMNADEEVVVTAMGISKKAKSAAPEAKVLSGKVSGIQITTIHPSGGQEKFDRYLEKNLKPVYNESHERLTGEVVLSFSLNNKGQPENIRVARSSCAACEKEAIRLLQVGPTWIGKKGDTGNVVIKF
jgi:hypothetical protein